MVKIVDIKPNDDYTLFIKLNNNHEIIYDIKPRLKTVRFCNLNDIKTFKNAKVINGNTILWNDLCQITIDEIINNIKK